MVLKYTVELHIVIFEVLYYLLISIKFFDHQMTRLRDQYKLQQQHLLKLLELLDVGNCVTVIEAECVRTESTIFDADIAFDLEAQSIHIPQDEESHSSNDLNDLSESSSLADDRFSISEKDDPEFDPTQFGDIMPDEIVMESILADLGEAVPDELDIGTLIDQLSNMSPDFAANGASTSGGRAEASGGFHESMPRDSSVDVIRVQIERDASRSSQSLDAEDGDAIVETAL